MALAIDIMMGVVLVTKCVVYLRTTTKEEQGNVVFANHFTVKAF